MKLNFSGLNLEQAMRMVPTKKLLPWEIDAPLREPSTVLPVVVPRMKAFAMFSSEAAKVLLIDTILLEVVPDYAALRVWKAEPLEAEKVSGVADYLIAANQAYVETPLLCAIEARRDDFEKGQVQCIAEMAACRDNNLRDGHTIDSYGIVSNGQGWVFYKLTIQNEVFVSVLFSTGDLPKLLGILHFVCAACAQNVP